MVDAPPSAETASKWEHRSAVCKVLSGALQLQGECHCLLKGDMLLLGRQHGKAEDMRLLSGASISIDDSIVHISPPEWLSRTLSIGFGSPQEAESWANSLSEAALLWESSARGRRRAAENASPEAKECHELTPSTENNSPGKTTDSTAALQGTSHPSIEHWIEAQIAQSSELLALFQEQELWLSETADSLANRRERDDDGDSLAVLEQEEVLQRSTISHLQAKVASLAFRANTAEAEAVEAEETLEEEPTAVRSQKPREKGWRLQDLARNATTTHPGLLNAGRIAKPISSHAAHGAALRARSVPMTDSMRQSRPMTDTEQGVMSNDLRQGRPRLTTTSSAKSGKSNVVPEQKWNLRKIQYNSVRGSPPARRTAARQ